MRVLDATAESLPALRADARTVRAANIELAGLAACTLVLALGLVATVWARLGVPPAGPVADAVNINAVAGAEALAPLLPMYEDREERLAAARALYRLTASADRPVTHVGALAEASVAATEIRDRVRYVHLRERLERRPGLATVPVLSAADLAAIKPLLVVRTRGEYLSAVRLAGLSFLGIFWVAHLVRRGRQIEDDPLLLPIVFLLTGVGLMSMIALRDPLRDTLAFAGFTAGTVAGVGLLLAVAEIDFERSLLRRAVFAPLAAALGLAALLLIFGDGPGTSGVKVNLFGMQPVEAIRLLVVFAVAAYFARRLELLRALSEPATPARPWLRYVDLPRWKDVRPIAISMALVLIFFFLQKDLGPALVVSAVVIALYTVARGRAGAIAAGTAMLALGFGAAYLAGYPATVGQRVRIWMDPWSNGVPGGNQIAHGLWALATGGLTGSGAGLGSPASIPAAHTDFVLAAIGEQLGFVGLAAIFALYVLLGWRCFRIAARAPGDYSAFLAAGVALALGLQALLIAAGLLGLFPLSGVVTPFLSYGKSSMLANCLAIGVVLAIARRQGLVRPHLARPLGALGTALIAASLIIGARAGWVQVLQADEIATASSLTEQADGGYRYEYNPRLVAAARILERGTIHDRHGLVLATSRPAEMQAIDRDYRAARLVPAVPCAPDAGRCYPLGGLAFHLTGDWNRSVNWGARNSTYLERDSDTVLKGFDDHQRVVTVVNPRTGAPERVVRRDYRDVLPLVRQGPGSRDPAVIALLEGSRDLRSSVDARLQSRVAAALRSRIVGGGFARGAAVVLDVTSGEVLASVSYPWPEADPGSAQGGANGSQTEPDRLLDRARYGLYPPGSTFKVLVAGAALRSAPALRNQSLDCRRLPDGRVGAYVKGWKRPVRDDPMDTQPHGAITLERALVVSCNAYFAQLAQRLGPGPVLDAANFFQIDAAQPATAATLRDTLPQAGYGQGDVLVSPLKMARVAAALAAAGRVLPLRWTVSQTDLPADPPRFLSAVDAGLLAKYLREAVTSGTGRAVAGNPTAIAGKTGTAEVDGSRAHSWFVGFAPYDGSRPIAFAVVVENAGYGARAAAPVASDIVTAARELGLFGGSAGGTK